MIERRFPVPELLLCLLIISTALTSLSINGNTKQYIALGLIVIAILIALLNFNVLNVTLK